MPSGVDTLSGTLTSICSTTGSEQEERNKKRHNRILDRVLINVWQKFFTYTAWPIEDIQLVSARVTIFLFGFVRYANC